MTNAGSKWWSSTGPSAGPPQTGLGQPQDAAGAHVVRAGAHGAAALSPAGGSAAVRRGQRAVTTPGPLVWNFDGPFARCLADAEDTLRRAVVLVGDVSRVALLVDLSLPALQRRVRAGDAVQPAWGRFLEHIERCELPAPPRVRHVRSDGPLLTLLIAYRN